MPLLSVDCSNGVGAIPLEKVAEKVKEWVKIDLYNYEVEEPEKLNTECGAEFVHKTQMKPSRMPEEEERHAALDGDADRLIYFSVKKDPSFPAAELTVIDGDKQFAFLMRWVQHKLIKLDLQEVVSHALVQTGYANGACTDFLAKEGINSVLAATGVKNIQPEACKFVIGGACEANGHGTIHVNWKELEKCLEGKEENEDA